MLTTFEMLTIVKEAHWLAGWLVGEQAAYSALETKLCDAYVNALYGDASNPAKMPCTQLCELYSDGRREKGNELMQNLPAEEVNPACMSLVSLDVHFEIQRWRRGIFFGGAKKGRTSTWLQQFDITAEVEHLPRRRAGSPRSIHVFAEIYTTNSLSDFPALSIPLPSLCQRKMSL